MGHALWGILGEWQCGHSDRGSALNSQRARRDEVRERDFLRLGTAILLYLRYLNTPLPRRANAPGGQTPSEYIDREEGRSRRLRCALQAPSSIIAHGWDPACGDPQSFRDARMDLPPRGRSPKPIRSSAELGPIVPPVSPKASNLIPPLPVLPAGAASGPPGGDRTPRQRIRTPPGSDPYRNGGTGPGTPGCTGVLWEG